ncbi:hypothetical protein HDU88_007261 [Geranomyces variabilis]|nr:hypothetical protein HDU88_007261 [Geranomyces variabilis]
MRPFHHSRSFALVLFSFLLVATAAEGSPLPSELSFSSLTLQSSPLICQDRSTPLCFADNRSLCVCADGSRASVVGRDGDEQHGGHGHEMHAANGHVPISPDSPRFWWTLAATVILVLIGGIFAGLTIGIMSLDTTNLEILRNSGTDSERAHATKIAPIRQHGHWVLTTLLLGNVVINETLPILFDSLVGGGVAAIIISTGLVVLFGEIIPNAVCARNGLAIGATFAPIVQVCMWFMAPIAWPIAKLLDFILGHDEGTVYARAQLKTLIRFHEQGNTETGLSSGDLIHDEVGIISAVLDLKDKTVMQIMTPIEDVFMMEVSQVIDVEIIRQLITRGHSRIPIYQHHRNNIVAILLAKRLIGYNVEKAKRVSDMPLSYLPMIDSETNLFDMLNFFQEGRSHMAAVAGRTDGSRAGNDDNGKAERKILGIITLEDVIEELIGEEIIDEFDEYIDVHSKIPVKRTPITKTLAKLLVTNITRGGSSSGGSAAPPRSASASNAGTPASARRKSRPPPHTPSVVQRAHTLPVSPRPATPSVDLLTASLLDPIGNGDLSSPVSPIPSNMTTTVNLDEASKSFFNAEIDGEATTRDERLVDAGWTVSPLNPDDRHCRKVLSRTRPPSRAQSATGMLPPVTVSAPGSIQGGDLDVEHAADFPEELEDAEADAKGERTPLLKAL